MIVLFTNREWALESIDKVEWSEDLGKGVRVNGTDTGVYGKGHYRFDRYGVDECLFSFLHRLILFYIPKREYLLLMMMNKNKQKLFINS